MPDDQEPRQKSVEKQEQERFPAKFDAVVLGHTLRNFDRDQAVTLAIAKLAGLVKPDASYTFAPAVDAAGLDAETTLAIEGFSAGKRRDINVHEGNNFTNNPDNDLPAGAELYQAYQRRLNEMAKANVVDPATVQKVKDLVNWLKAIERDKPIPTPSTLKAEDLSSFTRLFYAIKHDVQQNDLVADKATETITQIDHLFTLLLDTERQSSLETIYDRQLQSYEEKRKDDYRRLREHMVRPGPDNTTQINPDALATTQTMNGYDLTYLDISGLNIDDGGMTVAEQIVKEVKGTDTDIMILVDDVVDDAGEKLGKQFKIKIPKARSGEAQLSSIDLRDLANRLNISERLFGGGVNLIRNADFNGHPQIIGAPTTIGTQMNPENLFDAVQEYFDFPRYNAEQFVEKADEFAEKLGCDYYLDDIIEHPFEEHAIAERSMVFRIPDDTGRYYWITISEEDIPLYEKRFKDNKEENSKMLLEKTLLTEPSAIAELRLETATENMRQYVEEKNGERLLTILDDLNPAMIREFPPDMLMDAFACIADSPRSISQVWDKDNLRYRSTQQHLPDWITADIEEFKAARFDYLFLQKKVDTYMIGALQEYVSVSGDPQLQKRFADILGKIATSEEYKKSHFGQSYDHLIQNTLHYVVDDRVDQSVRAQALKSLVSNYGAEMGNHWRAIQLSDSALVEQVRAAFGDVINPVLEQSKKEMNVEPIPDVPRSYVIHPDQEAIYESLAVQEQNGQKPIVTILAEIGRPIKKQIQKSGLNRMELDASGDPINEDDVTFAGEVRTEGLLRLGKRYKDHQKVALQIAKVVKEVADIVPADTRIRIIRGSFPGIMSGELVTALFMDPRITPEMRNRILFCDYNQQDVTFDDSLMIDPALWPQA